MPACPDREGELALRPLRESELHAASRLCQRSKAHWGYGDAFMRMCDDELTLGASDLASSDVIGAFRGEAIVGVAQVEPGGADCILEKLFVDPDEMGSGLGRRLFAWATTAARKLGADQLVIEADPEAAPFYLAMGCTGAGSAPSGSIPGRTLPRFVFGLG